MYIIKNAFRCIGRSKGRNVLIGIICLVIAVSACIGLSIRQASESAKQSTLEGMSITASISYDRNSAMQQMDGSHQNHRADMVEPRGIDLHFAFGKIIVSTSVCTGGRNCPPDSSIPIGSSPLYYSPPKKKTHPAGCVSFWWSREDIIRTLWGDCNYGRRIICI